MTSCVSLCSWYLETDIDAALPSVVVYALTAGRCRIFRQAARELKCIRVTKHTQLGHAVAGIDNT